MCSCESKADASALRVSHFRTSGAPSNLHANWFAIETHDDESSQDNVDDYTYFFNMCGPLLNVPSFLASRISVFGNDVAVLQVFLLS
jgi:hypothetical protein